MDNSSSYKVKFFGDYLEGHFFEFLTEGLSEIGNLFSLAIFTLFFEPQISKIIYEILPASHG